MSNASQPNPEALRAFWDAVNDSLGDIDPQEGDKTAFNLARRLQGLLIQHGMRGEAGAFSETIHDYAENNGLDGEELEEAFFLAWESVIIPEGQDPVIAAAHLAGGDPMPEGFVKRAPAKVRRHAWVALGVSRQLSGNGGRVFFLSARKLAEAMNTDAMTSSRILNLLCKEGHLRKIGGTTNNRAQRFQFCYRGTEEQKNL